MFLDKQGKRWPRLRFFIFVFVVIFFFCSVMFVQSLFVWSQLQLPPSIQLLKARLKALQKKESQLQAVPTKPIWLQFTRALQIGNPQDKLPAKSLSQLSHPSPLPQQPDGAKKICLGFYSSWDSNSLTSFQTHMGQLTHVCTDWLTMVEGAEPLVAKPDRTIQSLAKINGTVLLPLLSNLNDENWEPEAVENIANGPEDRRSHFVSDLATHLDSADAGGVVIDWGLVDPTYKNNITRLLQEIAASLHAQNRELWLRIPMGRELKVYDLDALSGTVDRFIATLHDENSETDLPGPIASQDWFEGWLNTVIAYGRPSQWIVEMGSYGYDWGKGEPKAETISFADVMSRAGRAGLPNDEVKAPTYNPSFSYSDAGVEHNVWFLDIATFVNQLMAARKFDIGGIAIFQLGTEDPSIWQAVQFQSLNTAPETLARLGELKSCGVTHVGRGEFLSIEDTRSDGNRVLQVDTSGRIVENYDKFPSYLTVSHQGNGKDGDVAISFDDGPDPKWTPQVLDILKAKGVKASFFMVGLQMEANPEIVRRIVQEGHEIGVHTYTHPDLSAISEERVKIELNATQLLIETITGRSTILFRPPYNADSRPNSMAEIMPLKLAQDMGYLTVTEDIDPEDWEKPGADVILERVRQSRQLDNNVIILHDAGGDRSQTVEALPLVIDYLLARGDNIVSLGKLLGESPETLMPVVRHDQNLLSRWVSGSVFQIFHAVERFLWAFMIVATILIVIRTIAVIVLAMLQHRQEVRKPVTTFSPFLSILIAAYNEEKVIEKTLQSVLTTTYPGEISIWVVDDGSTDRTAELVESVAQKDSRVHLVRQPNKGKALALRLGLESVTSDWVVMLDADTQFHPDTLLKLVQPLQDEKVAAVSGHAKVGNLRTFIARCQSLEYICGFNLDRQAYHYLNCITVAPGAVSALKKSAIIQAGGISTDTLAEDTDLTLSLHREGFQIAYVSDALAFTEAPETLGTLARQRFRWAFGTIQCLWKHRDMVLNPQYRALGCFSLPSIWFFQVLLVAISPVIDIIVVTSLLLGWSSPYLYAYFAIFLLMDFLLAALACLMTHESLRQAWLTFPMRFIYRPMLSWVVWKSLFKAAKGVWVHWGKLERTASVS